MSTGLAVEVIAIFGPTGSGKTAVAELLADRLSTGVVSVDAMQVYDGLEILTNRSKRPTRMAGFLPLSHESSVGEFQPLAHAAIDELVAAYGSVVVAGGTGLYLRAALSDMTLPPAAATDARARWEATYDRDPATAYAELEAVDPDAAAGIHANDRRRVVRALELAEAGSSLAGDALWAPDQRHATLVIGLDVPTDVLDERIAARTREMFERGVVDEVKTAFADGELSRTAEKALGLREIVSLPPDEAETLIATRTRRYAAYQRKWMRRIPGIVMVDGDRSPGAVADAVLELACSR